VVVDQAMSDVKPHNQIEKDTCFYTFIFAFKGLLPAINVYERVGVIAELLFPVENFWADCLKG